MKKIKLTQNRFALVDNEDYEWLNQWKWYARKDRDDYYASRDIYNKSKKQIQMHRVIMNCPEDLVVDHIDGNKLNNQKSNLRVCTNSENLRNRVPKRLPTSKVVGVQKTPYNTFRANIMINGKIKYFPTRKNIEEAIRDRKEAESNYYGEYAPNGRG